MYFQLSIVILKDVSYNLSGYIHGAWAGFMVEEVLTPVSIFVPLLCELESGFCVFLAASSRLVVCVCVSIITENLQKLVKVHAFYILRMFEWKNERIPFFIFSFNFHFLHNFCKLRGKDLSNQFNVMFYVFFYFLGVFWGGGWVRDNERLQEFRFILVYFISSIKNTTWLHVYMYMPYIHHFKIKFVMEDSVKI